MTTTDKTGGPAFPIVKPNGYVGFEQGMTLWDWYAGHALSGILSDVDNNDLLDDMASANGEGIASVTAVIACAYADAMLAERKKRGIA